MSDTATAGEAAPADSARSRLAAAAAKRATKSTARRTSTRKPVARNAAAAKRGKYAPRVVGAIRTGAALLGTTRPLHAAILHRQAEPFAEALDEVAAEDARVAAFLDRITGALGKSGAWGKLATVTVSTAGAMMIAGGTVPTGPAGLALAFLAGELVQAAAMDAGERIARREADAAGVAVDPNRVSHLAFMLLHPAPPAAVRDIDDELDDGEQGYGLGYDEAPPFVPTVDEREHRPAWVA